MKIEKKTYKIVFKGKQFSLPVYVAMQVSGRQKVLVPHNQKQKQF